MRRDLCVLIGNSGPGIPQESQPYIFDPFFTTKQDTGTGLGLWLVDEMVKKNGGTIRMRTSTEPPHAGATFRIFLPYRHDLD